MAARHYWYDPNGKVVGFLAEDGKWFYDKTSGASIGYLKDKTIYAPEGTPIGQFDDQGKRIYSQKGQPLGYLIPRLSITPQALMTPAPLKS
jgi:hypothetical protein